MFCQIFNLQKLNFFILKILFSKLNRNYNFFIKLQINTNNLINLYFYYNILLENLSNFQLMELD